MLVEISCNPDSDVSLWTDKQVVDHVIDKLTQLDFFSKKDIVTLNVFRNKYSYVIFDLNYDKSTSIINTWADQQDINKLFFCGRFSELNI